MGQYLPIVAMIVLAVAFAGISLVTSRLLSPERSTRAKRAPYECGIIPSRDSPERFSVHFYMVAMLFIIFDIEIIFLYPWAMIHRDLGAPGLVIVVIFALPIFISLTFEMAHGSARRGRGLVGVARYSGHPAQILVAAVITVAAVDALAASRCSPRCFCSTGWATGWPSRS